ncbi:DUF99 family protein [Halomarina pelagica]|uniref:endonuclease dU n=1 Tax=Halomarina pelagica TaxID=2961599 RepID=UPI0020C3EA18|nr:DUF99 family protein [Halomarina sp. BND7]
MTVGGRALGIAESYTDRERSTVAGAVVRTDRALDGLEFSSISVGGTDSTERLISLWERLDREDVRYVLVAGVAPAWFNVVDLPRLAETVDRPVVAVSFEESEGLEPALREAFSGDALDERLDVYERLPERRRVDLNGETVYVRGAGIDADEADEVVRTFTPEGGRPEPLRVARLAARAADAFRHTDGL